MSKGFKRQPLVHVLIILSCESRGLLHFVHFNVIFCSYESEFFISAMRALQHAQEQKKLLQSHETIKHSFRIAHKHSAEVSASRNSKSF